MISPDRAFPQGRRWLYACQTQHCYPETSSAIKMRSARFGHNRSAQASSRNERKIWHNDAGGLLQVLDLLLTGQYCPKSKSLRAKLPMTGRIRRRSVCRIAHREEKRRPWQQYFTCAISWITSIPVLVLPGWFKGCWTPVFSITILATWCIGRTFILDRKGARFSFVWQTSLWRSMLLIISPR